MFNICIEVLHRKISWKPLFRWLYFELTIWVTVFIAWNYVLNIQVSAWKIMLLYTGMEVVRRLGLFFLEDKKDNEDSVEFTVPKDLKFDAQKFVYEYIKSKKQKS